jgi:hypothetical protein
MHQRHERSVHSSLQATFQRYRGILESVIPRAWEYFGRSSGHQWTWPGSEAVRLLSQQLPRTVRLALPHSPHLNFYFFSHISLHPDMNGSSSSSLSFQSLFDAALQDYANQTGTNLRDHPLAKQLEKCDTVDSISSVLQEQARKIRDFRGEDGRIMRSLKCVIHVLYTLATNTTLGEGIAIVCLKSSIAISTPKCTFRSHGHLRR